VESLDSRTGTGLYMLGPFGELRQRFITGVRISNMFMSLPTYLLAPCG
jgi:hypothetical protein